MRTELPTVPCPKCAGEGSLPLSTRLEETLSLVRKHPGKPLNAYVIRGIGQAAMYRRFQELLELDLIRRERQAHAWLWFAVK